VCQAYGVSESGRSGLTPHASTLYIYVDEAGNFDFSPKGSRFFSITCLVTRRPFEWQAPLLDLKYDCLEDGLDLEYFHASEDRQPIRDRFFATITRWLPQFEVYSVLISKNRANPSIREPERLFPLMLQWLMKYALPRALNDYTTQVVIVTDTIPVQRKRRAVEKAVKVGIKPYLPTTVRHRLLHHQSRSDLNLQAVDYVNWAVFRKWESADYRSYALIASAMRGEVDLFARGDCEYY
jgi:hypothetical protein